MRIVCSNGILHKTFKTKVREGIENCTELSNKYITIFTYLVNSLRSPQF